MRTATLLLVAFSVSLMAPAARSQPASAPKHSPSEIKEGMALFNQGNKLIDKGDYEGARTLFLAASAFLSSPENLYNLGYCEVRSGHFVEGVNHLRQFLRGPFVTSKDRSTVTEHILPLAVPHVAQLQIATKTGAAVAIDENAVGVAPLSDPIALVPGKHHVTASLNGVASSLDVEVAEGQTLTMSLPDIGTPATEPAATTAPPPRLEPVRQDSTLDEPHAAMSGGLTTGRKVAIGIGVVAVGVAGVGIGFGVSANNAGSNAASLRAGSLDTSCAGVSSTRCANLQSASSTAQSDAPVATGLFITGGVLAAGALAVWLLSPPRDTRSGLLFVPALDRTGAGLRLIGEF